MSERSRLNKFSLLLFPLAAVITGQGLAQRSVPKTVVSAAESAQRLAKIEEDLNSDDPNLRLATLEEAMTEGSASERLKARSIAFNSADKTLRALSLRYAICQAGSVAIRTNPDVNADNMFSSVQGLVRVYITECNVEIGIFSTESTDFHGSRPSTTYSSNTGISRIFTTVGGGRIEGTNLSISFVTGEAINRVPCTSNFRLDEGGVLNGQIRCTWNSRDVYASPAQINLF